MTSYSSRETRRVRLAHLIAESFKEGEEFTVWDVHALWSEKWDYCPTQKEISKILPLFGFEFDRKNGGSLKYYTYDGRTADELYQRRSRVKYGYELASDVRYEKGVQDAELGRDKEEKREQD